MREEKVRTLAYLATHDQGVVSDYTIFAFEKSLSKAGMPSYKQQRHRATVVLARVLAKLGLLRSLFRVPGRSYFSPLMGPAEFRLFPVCFLFETVIYCFDCWPPQYALWETFFKRHRIRVAFFSARQSAEHFRRRLPEMSSYWLAEAIDPSDYRSEKDLVDREIDVLELGRRHEGYHDLISEYLRETERVHRYERVKGEVVFPTRREPLRGLGNSKISVCFPSSVTHPARSGDVETVTHRYFESMAAQCVILGHCPAELHDLFGYNPVVEVDFGDPVRQIDGILSNVGDYQALVDRNYRRLMEVGTWDVRVCEMLSRLATHDYVVQP